MATIQSALRLNDYVTSSLRGVIESLTQTIRAFEETSQVSESAFDGTAASVAEINSHIEDVDNNLNQSTQAQRGLNSQIDSGVSKANNLASVVARLGIAYAVVRGTKAATEASDQYISSVARLNMMNDGLITTAELQDKIFEAAERSRGSYTEMTATVAKLGLLAAGVFTNSNEIVKFTEIMNKGFVIGGASMTEQASAMYQLTQAMASGRLQGDEYRSIIENAPLLAKAIEDYMINVKGAEGTMKDWASEGILTAEVIKHAVFDSAESTNRAFESMPTTFGQTTQLIKNNIYNVLQPAFQRLNDALNTHEVQEAINTIAETFGAFVSAILPHLDNIIIAVGALTAAWVAYKIIATTVTTVQAILNAVMAANPVFIIIMALIALISIIVLVVKAINNATDSSISAIGAVCAAFSAAGAFIYNTLLGAINMIIGIFVDLWNFIATFVNFFANVFNDPVGSIVRLFTGLADFILGILQSIATAIDWIFGSSFSDTIQGWRDDMSGWVDEKYGKNEEVMKRIDKRDWQISERISYEDALSAGYGFGEDIEKLLADIEGEANKIKDDINNQNEYGKQINENTQDISNSVSSSNENLKYLRDIAEREAINRFVSLEVDMSGMQNTINNRTDIDGFVAELSERIRDTLETMAEGDHV